MSDRRTLTADELLDLVPLVVALRDRFDGTPLEDEFVDGYEVAIGDVLELLKGLATE